MSDAAPDRPAPVPTHPEEMKAVFDLRVGRMITLQGSARITPAGVVTAGITLVLAAFAASLLMGGRRRH